MRYTFVKEIGNRNVPLDSRMAGDILRDAEDLREMLVQWKNELERKIERKQSEEVILGKLNRLQDICGAADGASSVRPQEALCVEKEEDTERIRKRVLEAYREEFEAIRVASARVDAVCSAVAYLQEPYRSIIEKYYFEKRGSVVNLANMEHYSLRHYKRLKSTALKMVAKICEKSMGDEVSGS